MIRNALGNLAGPAAGLASAPVLAQTVGVEGRGTVAAVSAPIVLAALIAGFGIPEAVTYHVARSARTIRGLRRDAALLAATTGAVGSLAVASSATLLLQDPEAARLLAVLAISAIVPAVLIGVLRAHAAGLGRWGLVSLERTVGPVLRLVAFLILQSYGRLDAGTAAVVMVTAPLAAGVVYLVRCDRPRGANTGEAPGRRSLLGYGARAWLGTLAGTIVMRLDQVLMVPLASAQQLGLYAVAVTVSELPLVVTSAVREVMLTTDARRRDDQSLARAARMATATSAVTAACLCGSAPWWLPVLFGEGFTDALPPALILAAAVVAGVPGSVAGAALGARGLPHLRSASLCVAALVNAALLVALVPVSGAVGAAIATVACNSVGGWVNVAHLIRKSSLRWRDFLLPSVDDWRTLVHPLRSCARRGATSGEM
ncbi:oligosaccharide flippase family protein [Curtobacterium sp. MCSS17_015]|nr:oligosaccharide flippase family protein [Curtobacterium sp. MCSS17_015]WIB28091.1 oligosaccharide flippase family protein [Curtobacterium sp. MCSS17_015]